MVFFPKRVLWGRGGGGVRATLKQKTKIEYLVLPLYTYLLQDICRNDFEIINHKYFVIAYGWFESLTEKRKKKKRKNSDFTHFPCAMLMY